jgi:hypothetical protein
MKAAPMYSYGTPVRILRIDGSLGDEQWIVKAVDQSWWLDIYTCTRGKDNKNKLRTLEISEANLVAWERK